MKLTKLYQRAANQKINTFEVEVQGKCFRTITGFEDGIKTESAWTCCEPKNQGKKNSTTAEEQAKKEAEALHRKKLELGFFEDINDIDKSTLFKPMLACDFNDYKDRIAYPVYVQPKLDGIRCIVRKDGMWSRNGKRIISAPHIYENIKHLFKINPDLVLDGELYIHSSKNDFNTICSLVKKTKPTEQDLKQSAQLIEYWIYDVPSLKGRYDVRKINLYQYYHISKVKIITTLLANNEDEVKKYYGQFVNDGFEGIMVRINEGNYENKRSKNLLKYKTFFDNEYTILEVHEGKGRLQNKVGQMLFKTEEGKEFYSTVNGTEEYLTELWNQKTNLIGQQATIKYFELTEDGVPRFPKVIAIRNYE
jgi:ATP-dependent DNA ligase